MRQKITIKTMAKEEAIKPDHKAILDIVPAGSSVLDLGCGNGELLHFLVTFRNVRGSGVEIDGQAVRRCAWLGLSVSQQDIDGGLSDYADKSFDFVILNQSLQQVVKLEAVLIEALRVGREVIIGFPNFAHYKARLQIFFSGRTLVTPSLPNMWYHTPNLQFLSISDFIGYCREKELAIKKAVFLSDKGLVTLFPNVFAQLGIFVIRKER